VGFVSRPEEATMSTPSAHPKPTERPRRMDDLSDLVEDLGFGLMLFSGAAIALIILALLFVL
jgi:hypothetical protein